MHVSSNSIWLASKAKSNRPVRLPTQNCLYNRSGPASHSLQMPNLPGYRFGIFPTHTIKFTEQCACVDVLHPSPPQRLLAPQRMKVQTRLQRLGICVCVSSLKHISEVSPRNPTTSNPQPSRLRFKDTAHCCINTVKTLFAPDSATTSQNK
jgi:hypothetical protein